MANAAMTASAASSGASTGGGQNPFWYASNYYAQKNNAQIAATTLSTTQTAFNLPLDSLGFMRGARVQVRSTGAVGGVATPDNPWNLFQNLSFNNVDGGNILYPMDGYAQMLYQAYGRPWQGNPTAGYDYAMNINPSFTLKLAPEIRYTAGALANTDARSQYRLQGNLALQSTVTSGTISTAPTVTTTTFVDLWAQVDSVDLNGVPNEQLPPGVNLMNQRRFQTFALSGAGSNNTVIATNCVGNEVRLAFLVVRDSNGARQDYLTDPIQWYIDQRLLSNYSPDLVQQYMEDFYGSGVLSRPTGVYVFPRFFQPGSLTGQGWLETSNASGLKWQSSTLSTASNTSGGTINVYVDEVFPAGGTVPGELRDL
jgi:hypothetical protein